MNENETQKPLEDVLIEKTVSDSQQPPKEPSSPNSDANKGILEPVSHPNIEAARTGNDSLYKTDDPSKADSPQAAEAKDLGTCSVNPCVLKLGDKFYFANKFMCSSGEVFYSTEKKEVVVL